MTRLSPSLLWFKTEIASLKGQVQRLEDRKRRHDSKVQHHGSWMKHHKSIVRETNCEIKALIKRIDSFSKAIDLHEVLVDIDDIEPVKPRASLRLTSHGGIARFILSELQNSPTRSRYTSELGDALILAFGQSASTDQEKKRTRFLLLSRLHNLVYSKRILKGCEPAYSLDRRWFLP